MKVNKCFIAPLICVVLAGCNKPSVTSTSTASVSPQQLVGVWKLKSVAGQDPSTINIKSYKAEFLKNGTWKYSGVMGGRYSGMQLQGSGKWQITNGSINYTAGANTGQSKSAIANNILTLSPDPVVMPDGKTRVISTYEKTNR